MPLTQEQLETLEDIGKVIAEALKGLSLNSQEGVSASHVGTSATQSSRNSINKRKHDQNPVAKLEKVDDVDQKPIYGSTNNGASNIYNIETSGVSQDQIAECYICSGDGTTFNEETTRSRLRKFGINEQPLTNYEGNDKSEGT
jgi:hypothetical protein